MSNVSQKQFSSVAAYRAERTSRGVLGASKEKPAWENAGFSLHEPAVFSFAADAEKQLLSGVFPPSDQ
jgi:hypothetical protein